MDSIQLGSPPTLHTSLQRSVGTLKKSVDSLYLLGDRAQKCADRITARARYTDTPAFQGQDGRRVHSVEKYGALRRGRGKNKGYLCWRLDMCLAKLVQNTNTDELIRQTTKLTASFTCTLTKSFNWRNQFNPKQCFVLTIFLLTWKKWRLNEYFCWKPWRRKCPMCERDVSEQWLGCPMLSWGHLFLGQVHCCDYEVWFLWVLTVYQWAWCFIDA